MTDCIRGCKTTKKHIAPCPVPDHHDRAWVATIITDEDREALCDGDHPQFRESYSVSRYGGIDEWQECRGCKPRDAKHGVFCGSCHNRLREWLVGPQGLYWVHWWLGTNLTATGPSAAKQDWQRPGADDGPAAPIRLGILDLRQLLSDVVYVAEERTREVFDLTQPVFDLAKALEFLAAWQDHIEGHRDLAVYVYDKFEEVMRDAGALCPWRDQPTRLRGIPCPDCDRVTLVRYDGSDNTQCTSCRLVMNPWQYEYWTKVMAEEAAS